MFETGKSVQARPCACHSGLKTCLPSELLREDEDQEDTETKCVVHACSALKRRERDGHRLPKRVGCEQGGGHRKGKPRSSAATPAHASPSHLLRLLQCIVVTGNQLRRVRCQRRQYERNEEGRHMDPVAELTQHVDLCRHHPVPQDCSTRLRLGSPRTGTRDTPHSGNDSPPPIPSPD